MLRWLTMSLRRSFRELPPTEGEYFTGRMPRSRFWILFNLIAAGVLLGAVLGMEVVAATERKSSPIIAKLNDWLTAIVGPASLIHERGEKG